MRSHKTGCKARDVLVTVGVAVAFHLAEVRILHTVDRAFQSAPERELVGRNRLVIAVAIHIRPVFL
jgi:hypothetical protein